MDTSPASSGINTNQDMGNLSYFRKTVTLRNWWLKKADGDYRGKRLAVEGYVYCSLELGIRVFSSAPIIKKFGDFGLETADGIVVMIEGLINKNRTIENGFPSELCSHFLCGFPPDWEDIAAHNYLEKVVTTGFDSKNTSELDMPTNSSGSTIKLSDKKGIKKCSGSTLHAESDIQQKMLKASKGLRNSSDNLTSKENAEQKGGSSMWKARRKIIFDTSVESPRTQKSKVKKCVVSPEFLRLGRSRSGRLLLPTLEFWRNQIPIYDMDRSVTGIQEEVSSSAGSKSEPKKRQKKRRY